MSRREFIAGCCASVAAAGKSKNQLSRNFRRRAIFDFCNTIGGRADVILLGASISDPKRTSPSVRIQTHRDGY
jgi:hypothetical protein